MSKKEKCIHEIILEGFVKTAKEVQRSKRYTEGEYHFEYFTTLAHSIYNIAPSIEDAEYMMKKAMEQGKEAFLLWKKQEENSND